MVENIENLISLTQEELFNVYKDRLSERQKQKIEENINSIFNDLKGHIISLENHVKNIGFLLLYETFPEKTLFSYGEADYYYCGLEGIALFNNSNLKNDPLTRIKYSFYSKLPFLSYQKQLIYSILSNKDVLDILKKKKGYTLLFSTKYVEGTEIITTTIFPYLVVLGLNEEEKEIINKWKKENRFKLEERGELIFPIVKKIKI